MACKTTAVHSGELDIAHLAEKGFATLRLKRLVVIVIHFAAGRAELRPIELEVGAVHRGEEIVEFQ